MFCLDYYPSQKYLQDADEFKIKYRPSDRTLEDFLNKYINKSIVIDVSDSFEQVDAQLLKGLSDKYQNIKIIFNFNKKDYLSRAEKYNIPHFFTNPITSIDQLWGLIKYNPTDMYICSELGFSLDKISRLLHENNIKVRVFPNICQSTFFSEIPSIKTFFIRPEDIPAYSQYVDVFELVTNEKTQRILFKIYKQNKWIGQLKDIIPTFKDQLDNKYLLKNFGELRSKCGKRCMYTFGGCNICDRFIDIVNLIEESKDASENQD